MLDLINEFMPIMTKMLGISLILSIIMILVGGYLHYFKEEIRVWPFIQTLESILMFVMGSLALFFLSVTLIVILLE